MPIIDCICRHTIAAIRLCTLRIDVMYTYDGQQYYDSRIQTAHNENYQKCSKINETGGLALKATKYISNCK